MTDIRERMIRFREDHGVSLQEMAERCKCSISLLAMVEGGDVTHPKTVERIRKKYGLTKREAEPLLPINYRKHGGEYDPNRYKDMFACNRKLSLTKMSSGMSPNKIRMV